MSKDLKFLYHQCLSRRQIVGVLGVVDSALELADRVIAKTERLKKGLMQQLLTHGIGHTEYKQTPIGKIPKGWQIALLKDVTEDFKEEAHPQHLILNIGMAILLG